MKKYKYDLFFPSYNGKAIQQEIKKFFPIDGSNQWIGQASRVDEVEKKLADKFGFKYPVMVNSGTSALDLAYHLIGIKEEDEILCACLSCSASWIPLIHRKAKIVFVDIEKNTLTIDPIDIEKKITKNTKAIVAVALGGIPINEKIFKIGKKYKIPVVVDAAQAIGYNKGDYLIYSFQAIKQITCTDGGLLVVRNKKEYERARKLRWFGIQRDKKIKNNWQAWKGRAVTCDIEDVGFKMQPTDLDALLLNCGLNDYDKYQNIRKKLSDIYRKELSKIPQIKLFRDNGTFNWLFGIQIEDRDKLAKYLDDEGVGTNVVHTRNDLLTIFKRFKNHCPNMDEINLKYLYLPLHPRLKENDIYSICNIIKKYYQK